MEDFVCFSDIKKERENYLNKIRELYFNLKKERDKNKELINSTPISLECGIYACSILGNKITYYLYKEAEKTISFYDYQKNLHKEINTPMIRGGIGNQLLNKKENEDYILKQPISFYCFNDLQDIINKKDKVLYPGNIILNTNTKNLFIVDDKLELVLLTSIYDCNLLEKNNNSYINTYKGDVILPKNLYENQFFKNIKLPIKTKEIEWEKTKVSRKEWLNS